MRKPAASPLSWSFPLPRTHTGPLLGNSTLGVMVWGGGRRLCLTLGRADLWDHRGGLCWSARQNYADIRRCLENNDAAGIRRLFAPDTERQPGQPARPCIIPIGRIDLDFGAGAQLLEATLSLARGELAVTLARGGRRGLLRLTLHPREPLLLLALPPGWTPPRVRPVPVWQLLQRELTAIGFTAPRAWRTTAGGGWFQALPADPGVGVAWETATRGLLAIAAPRAADLAAARVATTPLLAGARREGYAPFARRAAAAWGAFWRSVPAVTLPNPVLQEIHDYGLYKFGAATAPHGVACGLQGPWIEEYQLPPWSADYHFNINVQMCYGPAFRANRLQNLRPLFDLIASWMPTLRENARLFAGVGDGVMLPHAVDDRCTCMGSFWTGCIDHGCTAWVADMMYAYYTHSGDRAFLRDTAWPFMRGAMRVYEAMLERDGDRLTLPLSVSPEYRGAEMNAWGRNASFQLACVHRLAEDLLETAAILGEKPSPAWPRIRRRLPLAATVESKPGEAEIALWEGLLLEESHRHHSHLAGVSPFDTIDLDDPRWRATVSRSIERWIREGMGLWSGWCMPWAAAIHSRLGNGDMAELTLEIWHRVFTNSGRGTLHNAGFAGLSLIGAPPPFEGRRPPEREIMQLDAGMGAVAAVQEMLLHPRRGVLHLFPGVPASWREAAFEPMLVPGAFRVGARRVAGQVSAVEIHATVAGMLRLANPWGATGHVRLRRNGRPGRCPAAAVLSLRCAAGDHLTLTPA